MLCSTDIKITKSTVKRYDILRLFLDTYTITQIYEYYVLIYLFISEIYSFENF